jgi:uncharacterized protein YyaL (SSP411 family)
MILKLICPLLGLALLIGTAWGEKDEKKANRLAKEKSPYLLQHAYNPVDWYPWGEEAFKKARDEKKLILLSVGYSTCHWCHVMERESFENEKIAGYLNKNFVAIKLDREERPDVDQVYMTAFQAMTQQSGGWPLNMFLTPDLKPLTGGTYFPPEDKDGRPGFFSVLKQIQGVWGKNREELLAQSKEMHARMGEYFAELHEGETEAGDLKASVVAQSLQRSLVGLDPEWGGLGTEMKFPQASIFRFLLQSGDEKAREAILKTCRHMMNGGIHDQVMGGFHRYSVDREWLVPHFEKMLYDQAQLLELYLDAWQISGDESFREVAAGITEYVLRDLTHPEGGFYCAQDAQSEGKEGKCFCWTVEELEKVLDAAEMKVAREILGVTDGGNFIDHSDPEPLKNLNILHFKKPRESCSAEEEKAVAGILAKLAKVRETRVPPATDDKVLASWNGMMIGALARAGRVMNEPRYLAAARKAHDFVKGKLWDKEEGRLYHRWREGERDESVQAESYLMLLAGTRKLYEAEVKAEDLAFCVQLAEGALKLFYDEKNGGFYQGEKRPDLVLRLKGQFDGAIPTESSVAVREFAVLAKMTDREDFKKVAEKTLRSYLGLIKEAPAGMGEMLMSLDFYLDEPGRIVIAGEEGREAMLKVAAGSYDPHRVIVGTEGPVSEFTAGLKAIDEKATAYYCVGQSCQLPVNDPVKLAALLIKMSAESK